MSGQINANPEGENVPMDIKTCHLSELRSQSMANQPNPHLVSRCKLQFQAHFLYFHHNFLLNLRLLTAVVANQLLIHFDNFLKVYHDQLKKCHFQYFPQTVSRFFAKSLFAHWFAFSDFRLVSTVKCRSSQQLIAAFTSNQSPWIEAFSQFIQSLHQFELDSGEGKLINSSS